MKVKKTDYILKNNLKSIQKTKKCTQYDLSWMLGIDQSQLNRYISGRQIPGLDIALIISKLLKMHVEDIFFLQPKSSSAPDKNGCVEKVIERGEGRRVK